jgi:uncharacterized protein (DUF433 family)
MTLAIEARPIPLSVNEFGILMVNGTRIPLDTIVYAFRQGATAEDIVQSYDTLKLSDVYAIIAYYLDNQHEVDNYLEHREVKSKEVHQFIDTHFDQSGFRERLLARQKRNAQAVGR